MTTPARTLNPWRRPQITRRFFPVFLRNFMVWRTLAIPSLVGNIAEPLIWLVAFGYADRTDSFPGRPERNPPWM